MLINQVDSLLADTSLTTTLARSRIHTLRVAAEILHRSESGAVGEVTVKLQLGDDLLVCSLPLDAELTGRLVSECAMQAERDILAACKQVSDLGGQLMELRAAAAARAAQSGSTAVVDTFPVSDVRHGNEEEGEGYNQEGSHQEGGHQEGSHQEGFHQEGSPSRDD